MRHWTIDRNPYYENLLGGTVVKGFFVDHPDFTWEWGHTSPVVRLGMPDKDNNQQLETRNSRYVLVGKGLTWDEYVKRRAALEGPNKSAYKLLKVDDNVKPDNTKQRVDRTTKNNGLSVKHPRRK